MKKQNQQKTRSSEVNKIDLLKGGLLYDSVLLKPIVVESDSVVLRPQQYEDKPEWGEVIMVGDGRVFDNGEVGSLRVRPGSIVLFQKYSAQKFRHKCEDYLIIREDDIFWHDNK